MPHGIIRMINFIMIRSICDKIITMHARVMCYMYVHILAWDESLQVRKGCYVVGDCGIQLGFMP